MCRRPEPRAAARSKWREGRVARRQLPSARDRPTRCGPWWAQHIRGRPSVRYSGRMSLLYAGVERLLLTAPRRGARPLSAAGTGLRHGIGGRAGRGSAGIAAMAACDRPHRGDGLGHVRRHRRPARHGAPMAGGASAPGGRTAVAVARRPGRIARWCGAPCRARRLEPAVAVAEDRNAVGGHRLLVGGLQVRSVRRDCAAPDHPGAVRPRTGIGRRRLRHGLSAGAAFTAAGAEAAVSGTAVDGCLLSGRPGSVLLAEREDARPAGRAGPDRDGAPAAMPRSCACRATCALPRTSFCPPRRRLRYQRSSSLPGRRSSGRPAAPPLTSPRRGPLTPDGAP